MWKFIFLNYPVLWLVLCLCVNILWFVATYDVASHVASTLEIRHFAKYWAGPERNRIKWISEKGKKSTSINCSFNTQRFAPKIFYTWFSSGGVPHNNAVSYHWVIYSCITLMLCCFLYKQCRYFPQFVVKDGCSDVLTIPKNLPNSYVWKKRKMIGCRVWISTRT